MKDVDALYIHFPFCRHLCNYCDFYKHKLTDEEQVNQFEKIMKKQISEHQKFLTETGFEMKKLETLYIGGGTPSLWSKRGSSFMKDFILNSVSFKDNYEFTIEIDPGTWTVEEVNSWRSIGVNRFSIGVQSFNDDYLEILDREHNKKEAAQTLEYLKSINANYSIDLMLGLPKLEKPRKVLDELKELMTYGPSHFSVYILKCRKNYPHYTKLPEDEEVSDEYLEVCNFLNEHDYKQYEVSNFSKEGLESVHNKKYWKYDSVAAIGPNSAGLLVLDKENSVRYKWKTQSSGFETENLSGTSLMIEKLYMQLRSKGCFDRGTLNEKNFAAFTDLKNLWESRGYVALGQDEFELTAQGYLMLDSLMDDVFNSLTI